jgi:hypothetical protein
VWRVPQAGCSRILISTEISDGGLANLAMAGDLDDDQEPSTTT